MDHIIYYNSAESAPYGESVSQTLFSDEIYGAFLFHFQLKLNFDVGDVIVRYLDDDNDEVRLCTLLQIPHDLNPLSLNATMLPCPLHCMRGYSSETLLRSA